MVTEKDKGFPSAFRDFIKQEFQTQDNFLM